jgi:hypothetical protein
MNREEESVGYVNYCVMCRDGIVSEDHEYPCPRCEETFCQSCYMTVPSGIDIKSLKMSKYAKKCEKSGDDMPCVYCQYKLEFEQNPIYKP